MREVSWGWEEESTPAPQAQPKQMMADGQGGGWGFPEDESSNAQGGGWSLQEEGANGGNGGNGENGANERSRESSSNNNNNGRGGRRGPQERDRVKDEQLVQGLLDTLQSVHVKLADKQADVNSPLYSVQNFEQLGLDEQLLKGIYAMKFVKPSKVQERALPLLLANPPQNMIAQSQSGTGKTAAFVLTMLSRVDTTTPEAGIQAVCLTPTRELARQILDVVQTMGQFTGVTAALALPETVGVERAPITAHLVIGTPGTMLTLERRQLMDLSRVRIFVLDEADVMLDKEGMGMQSMRVRNACPEECQLLLFSATFSDSVMEFAHRIIPNANELTLKREELSVDAIKQYWMDCRSYHHKMDMLSALYGLMTIGQSIIFMATRASAEEVQARMESEGHRTSLIHGGMEPAQRDAVIDEFRQGKTKVLLATNVLARGIDIQQVSLVVNFDMPLTAPDRLPDPETYLHRIGRTGRFGRVGIAINFISNRESREALEAFREFFGREIVEIPTDDLELLESKLASTSIESSNPMTV